MSALFFPLLLVFTFSFLFAYLLENIIERKNIKHLEHIKKLALNLNPQSEFPYYICPRTECYEREDCSHGITHEKSIGCNEHLTVLNCCPICVPTNLK
jgi:hypothetical protein